MNNFSAPVLLYLFVLFLGLLLNIVAFSTPHWLSNKDSDSIAHFGLWVACLHSDCTTIGVSCQVRGDIFVPHCGGFSATRAFAIISLGVSVFALLLAFRYVWEKREMLKTYAILFAGLAGACQY